MKTTLLLRLVAVMAAMWSCAAAATAKDVTLDGATTAGTNKNIRVTYALNGTDRIARVKKVVDNNVPTKKSCVIPASITVDGTAYKVTIIGKGAFMQTSFERVQLPVSVTEIAAQAFFEIGYLKECAIPASVTKIGDEAFAYNSLKTVTIPAGCSSVGASAFANNDLATVSFGAGATPLALGSFAFGQNSIASLELPVRLAKMGQSCFAGNNLLASVTINGTLSEIPESCFSECGRLASVTVNAPVSDIGDFAFFRCGSLSSFKITSVNTLRRIGDTAFEHCAFTTLNQGLLPYGLSKIGNNAFHSNAGLVSLALPVTVTEIGSNAFMGCPAIAEIECMALQPPVLLDASFDAHIYPECRVTVLPSLVDKYRTAQGWRYFNWSHYDDSAIDLTRADDPAPVRRFTPDGRPAPDGARGLLLEQRGTRVCKVYIP